MQAGPAVNSRISGNELRARIKRLGLTYARAAECLGLTLDGLNKQMRGVTAVSRQTAIILGYLEKEDAAQRAPRREDELSLEQSQRRDHRFARDFFPTTRRPK